MYHIFFFDTCVYTRTTPLINFLRCRTEWSLCCLHDLVVVTSVQKFCKKIVCVAWSVSWYHVTCTFNSQKRERMLGIASLIALKVACNLPVRTMPFCPLLIFCQIQIYYLYHQSKDLKLILYL